MGLDSLDRPIHSLVCYQHEIHESPKQIRGKRAMVHYGHLLDDINKKLKIFKQ